MKNNPLVVLKRRRNGDLKTPHDALDDAFFLNMKNVDTSAAENAIDMIFRFELLPSPRLIFVSPSCRRITGYTPEEYYTDQNLVNRIVHPEDRGLLQQFINLDNAGNFNSIVLRWIRKDGSIIWTEQSQTVIFNERGEPREAYIIARDIGEQKRAEKAQHESEDKYKHIFNNVNAVIVHTNKFGKIMEVNSRVEEAFGFKREDIIGKHFARLGFLTLKDLPRMVKLFGKAMRGKQPTYQEELETRDKAGNKKYINVNSTVVKRNGKIDGTISMIHDITERRKADEALRASEEKFSKVFNSSLNAICIFMAEGEIILDVNDSFSRFTGYAREEAIGRNALELGLWVNEEDRATMKKIIREKGRLYNHEFNSCMKSGEIRTGLFSVDIIEIGGELCGILVVTDITEQKWAENALRENEEFTASLLKETPSPIFVTYLDTSIKYVNPAFEKLTGYCLNDIVGMKSPYPWWPEETRREIRALLNSSNFGEGAKKEMAYRKKNGEDFWVELHAALITQNGEKRYILVAWVDITERKRMEMTLRESEEKFSKAFNASPSIMSITSLDGKYIEVNDSFSRISGYTREEAVNRSSSELDIWANPKEHSRFLSRIREQGHFYNEEFQFRNKTGDIQTVLFSAERINIGGKPCLISVGNDITERKQIEKALKSSEEKFRELISTSFDGIISIDSQMKVNVWNHGAERLFGYTEKEMLGESVLKIVPENDREAMMQKCHQNKDIALIPPMNMVFETSGLKKDGNIIPLDLSVSLRKAGGNYFATAIMRDISERKKAVAALKESEEKFSKAFSSASDAMAIFASNSGHFIEVNDSYIRLSGYSRDELIGRNADELNMWGNSAERERIIKLSLESGRVVHEVFDFRTKSGEIRTCLFSAESMTVGGERRMITVIQDITENKRAEQALRESEEKFSRAFSSSAASICITSLEDNKLIEVNESYSRFTGYAREEVLGHTAGELGFWVNREEQELFTSMIQSEGRIHNLEIHSRMKSGEIRVGLASAEAINISGKPCRIVVITDITERKQAEKALQESEEKFSKAFLASPDAIAISTVEDGRFIDINESFVRMMGYSRAEAIGHTSHELNIWLTEDSREKLVRILKDQGGIHNELFEFRKKSGEIGLGLFSSELITIGNEPCMISVNVDVTQQKKAEEHLRLLSSVTQQITDSTIVTDADFKITYMNKAAQELFGYSIEEALGTDISLLDVTPLSEDILNDMHHTLAESKTWTAILPKKRKDGSTFLCDCKRCPMYDENGRLTSYIIVHHDITEQKEFEARLKAHKQLIESILTSMPEGVLVTDKADRIMLANEAFRRIFHTVRKTIENRPLNETIHVEQLLALYKSIKAGETDNNSLEFRYKVKNQEKIIDCVIIKMGGERMLLTFTDVSWEREEEDKMYLMDRLASLGQMAAGLAHELNNPLTGILTLSQLLVNSDLTGEQKEDMQCVYNEAKRAANIVKNVLLFTRNNNYENGQSSVNEVVKEVLRLREHEESINNINVVTALPDDLPEVGLDKYQLQQVFLNIILNAEAAMKEAGRPGILKVTTERANNHVNITFSDNGCGIKKNILPRIFDPFFTTKEIGKGTGLGLSICYGIIVKHGGKISVRTRVGQGTTFTVKLPAINTEKRD